MRSRVKHLYLFNQIGETSGPSSAFLAEEELTRSVDGISPEFDTTDNFKEKLGFSTLLATMSPNTRNRILAAKNGMYESDSTTNFEKCYYMYATTLQNWTYLMFTTNFWKTIYVHARPKLSTI